MLNKSILFIRIVRDNLNTHTYGSFYERFEQEEARYLCKKIEFHYTPKKLVEHGRDSQL